MALTPLQLRDVCYGKNPCRYMGSYSVKSKFVQCCTKKAPSEYAKLSKHVDRNKMGNNCPGYLFLKHAKQGYDIPGSI